MRRPHLLARGAIQRDDRPLMPLKTNCAVFISSPFTQQRRLRCRTKYRAFLLLLRAVPANKSRARYTAANPSRNRRATAGRPAARPKTAVGCARPAHRKHHPTTHPFLIWSGGEAHRRNPRSLTSQQGRDEKRTHRQSERPPKHERRRRPDLLPAQSTPNCKRPCCRPLPP